MDIDYLMRSITKSPLVVHCKQSNYDVYVGRGACPKTGKISKWGNPYKIGYNGSRPEVIRKYAEWLLSQRQLVIALPELKNKTISCWCVPQWCHGHVLSFLANYGVVDDDGRTVRW